MAMLCCMSCSAVQPTLPTQASGANSACPCCKQRRCCQFGAAPVPHSDIADCWTLYACSSNPKALRQGQPEGCSTVAALSCDTPSPGALTCAGVPKAPVPHSDVGDWWTLYDYGLEEVSSWAADYVHEYPGRAPEGAVCVCVRETEEGGG